MTQVYVNDMTSNDNDPPINGRRHIPRGFIFLMICAVIFSIILVGVLLGFANQPIRIVQLTGNKGRPSISPVPNHDEYQFAFVNDGELYTADINGQNLQKRTTKDNGFFIDPEVPPLWSPNSQYIAVLVNDNLALVDLNSNQYGLAHKPLMSPSKPISWFDDNLILYSSNGDLFVKQISGTKNTMVTVTDSGKWSPNLQKYAYMKDGQIHIYDLLTLRTVSVPYYQPKDWSEQILNSGFRGDIDPMWISNDQVVAVRSTSPVSRKFIYINAFTGAIASETEITEPLKTNWQADSLEPPPQFRDCPYFGAKIYLYSTNDGIYRDSNHFCPK